jgi:hypothetical protein
MGPNLIVAAAAILLQSSAQIDSSTASQENDTLASEVTAGLGYERLSDALQYTRVQGLSLGIGYHVPLPAVRHTAGFATIRYGFSDERLTGRLSVIRDAPGWSMAISGYHDVEDVDPFASSRSFSNTLNGLFAGHDNGDYAMADGGSISLELPIGSAADLRLSTRVERQSSTPRVAQSEVNDFLGGNGLFPLNPTIREGVFGGLLARVSKRSRLPWNLTLDLLSGEGESVARVYGDVRASFGRGRQIVFRLKAGAGTEAGLPQMLFRLGGLHTVRGFEYAGVRAPTFWAGQLDLSPFTGRFRPVAFLDAGQGGPLSELLSTGALVGGGLGLALLHDLLRLDLSRPLLPRGASSKIRFDITFLGVR